VSEFRYARGKIMELLNYSERQKKVVIARSGATKQSL
jgi:hypothetical protein